MIESTREVPTTNPLTWHSVVGYVNVGSMAFTLQLRLLTVATASGRPGYSHRRRKVGKEELGSTHGMTGRHVPAAPGFSSANIRVGH